MEKHQCCIRVSDSGGWHRYPCRKSATIEVDGKWYCGTHNPIKVKEKRNKATEKYERAMNIKVMERIAGSACIEINPDNPMAVAGSVKNMFEALEKVQEDINWMLNNGKFLNPNCFDYLEKTLAKAEEK